MVKIQKQEAAKLTEPHLNDGMYNPYTENNQGYVVKPSEQASVNQSDNQKEIPFPVSVFVLFIIVMVLLSCSTIGLKSLFEALVPKIGNKTPPKPMTETRGSYIPSPNQVPPPSPPEAKKKPTRQRSADK